jgi:transposase
MKRKYRVALSESDRKHAIEVLNKPGTTETCRKRAKVLLMADENAGKERHTKAEIAARCEVSEMTVYNVLKEYYHNGIIQALSIKKPAGERKRAIIYENELKIISLAEGAPPPGYARWTIRLLTEKARELKLMETGSRETIRRMLKRRAVRLD